MLVHKIDFRDIFFIEMVWLNFFFQFFEIEAEWKEMDDFDFVVVAFFNLFSDFVYVCPSLVNGCKHWLHTNGRDSLSL